MSNHIDDGQLHATRQTFGKLMENLLHDVTVTDGAKVLYAHMHWRYGSNKRNFEGQKSMARALGVSETTIGNRIQELEAKDWLVVIERGLTTDGTYQTPFYHVFERQDECKEFRAEYVTSEGEHIREKSPDARERKGRKGVGGNPKLKRKSDPDNSSLPANQPNSSSDGQPNSSSDYPDTGIYPDSKKHSAPNGAGASQPKPRKREPFYDAIADVWETDASGIIVTIRSIMQGTATRRTIKDCNFNPPVTDVEEIYAFRPFMQARMAEKKMSAPPSAYTTIQAWFYDFRKGRAQRATNGYIPPEQRTSPLDFIRWAEGCEPEWAKDKGAE